MLHINSYAFLQKKPIKYAHIDIFLGYRKITIWQYTCNYGVPDIYRVENFQINKYF